MPDDLTTQVQAALLSYCEARRGTKASAVLYGDCYVPLDDVAARVAAALVEMSAPHYPGHSDRVERSLRALRGEP